MRSPTIVSGQRRSLLPVLGLAAGLWAVLPPYSGPPLNTADVVEVVDHVVPGVVLVALSVGMLWVTRRAARPGAAMFVAGLVVLLAGIWMTATHLPLVAQASDGMAPVGAVVYHTLPGLAITVLGLVWVAAHWADAGETQGGRAQARAQRAPQAGGKKKQSGPRS